jgi:MFS family permease
LASSTLPRPVRLLGWTSLLTDAATEAIYPLLPIFVTRVLGASAVSVGVIEGAADAISSVLKIVAGRASDRLGRRKPFVIAGYSVAGLVRPLIAFATIWQHVLAVRLVDRVGKGLRGAPRDAMLGALAPDGERGRVFGYHRAMDHAGAVVGPLAATAFLWCFPDDYRTLFALSIVPGLLAIAMLTFVPEVAVTARGNSSGSADAAATAARSAGERRPKAGYPTELQRFLVILTLFALGNSTDAFLLLRLSDAGLAVTYLPIAWAGLHLVKSSLAARGGALSDRFGRRRLIIAGWLLYAVVYAGFAFSESLAALLVWFLVYGVHFALAEGSEKALIADLAPPHLHGSAFGWYNAVLGFAALGASVLFGVLWTRFSPATAFLTGAALALTAAGLLAADRRLASPA